MMNKHARAQGSKMSQHAERHARHLNWPFGLSDWQGILIVVSPVALLLVLLAPIEFWMKAVLALATALVLLLFGIHERVNASDVRSIGILMWMLTVVLAGTTATVFLAPSSQLFFLKLFLVVVLSVLPGWLYFQFVKVRGKTLWDEYVLSLYRLKAASEEYLPAPPVYSRYCKPGQEIDAQEEASKLFRQKFESVYGEIMVGGDQSENAERKKHARGETFRPVLFATVLLTAAWSLLLQPDPYGNFELLPGAETAALADLPVRALQFGFLGAYLFILQMLMRRYFQNDLKAAAYISVVVRIISVSLIVLALDQVLPSDVVNSGSGLAFAFVVGMFPHVGIQAIRVFISNRLRDLVPSLQSKYPLDELDGLDVWYEARLLEEGIEDMQNLSTANLVDLLLHTRVPLERLVDWVDQAHLYLRVEGPKRESRRQRKRREKADIHLPDSDRAKLRQLGIRTATDLQDAFARPKRSPGMTNENYAAALAENQECMEGLLMVLNTEQQKEDGWPSRLYVILKTLEGEPNLYHVRAWKQTMPGDPSQEVGAAPTPPKDIDLRGDNVTRT